MAGFWRFGEGALVNLQPLVDVFSIFKVLFLKSLICVSTKSDFLGFLDFFKFSCKYWAEVLEKKSEISILGYLRLWRC